MKAVDIILKAMRRAKVERGLRVLESNNELSVGHIQKADHNLIVMTDLDNLKHEDWVVISAYYSMYQASTALLVKIGLESKDHATTAAVLEYFFGEQLSRDLIKKFDELKERKDKIEAITINERYIDYLWKTKRARETVQYGISVNYGETEAIMRNARDFVNKIKLVISELDKELLTIIKNKIKELKKILERSSN